MIERITVQDKVDLTKNLSVMLQSGITLNEALHSLGETARSRAMKNVLLKMNTNIEAGNRLSSALRKERNSFDGIFVGLVEAGERSGKLQDNLKFLSAWLERNNDLKREISAATLYPKLVLSAAAILGAGLSVFILPRLVPLFEQLNTDLPLITKILLAVSLFLQKHWIALFVGIVLCIGGFLLLERIRSVRKTLQEAYSFLPVIGGLLRDYELALITQLFHTLLSSGLSMNESISIVCGAVSDVRYQDSFVRIRTDVESGTTLSNSMKKYPRLYPLNVIAIIKTGEKSGTLSDVFLYLSEYYSKEVSEKAKKLPTVLEPILLICIALVVGFIALSIITPIYKLTGSLNR